MTADTPTGTARHSVAIYWWGLALAVLLVGLLVLNNRQGLLEIPLYETSDAAANSLFVREAKSHFVIHGHYSRWGFYHPGPVLFYAYALGEVVLYDWLHVVPAPLNGQTLSACALLTLLFSLTLVVFAQRLGARRGGYAFFLPLALLFAVWHYGTAVEVQAFTAVWPACPLVLVFLCFVVAASSVASGGGRELPLVAFAGGWLVHNHVAQPVFVVPMTLLAYGGLLVSCRRRAAEADPAGRGNFLAAGWRIFPRAHLVAAAVLAVFILPLVIDMTRGEDSNFHLILTHLRGEHGPLNKFVRSLCYFLTFGGYTGYTFGEPFFGRYSAAGMLAYVFLHWRAYLGWLVALAMIPILFAVARRSTATPVEGSDVEPEPAGRESFLRWFGVMTAVAIALTLYWGMKQDGPMYYFNAYFNYSIFFCVALGLAAALAVFLQAVTSAPHLRRARGLIVATLVGGTAVAAFSNAAGFKNTGLADPGAVAIVQATNEAAKTLQPGQICYLDLSNFDNWPDAVAIALQLDRLGHRVRVNDNWVIMFGDRRVFSRDGAASDQPVAHWRIAPSAKDLLRPLATYSGIHVVPLVDIDPAGGKVRFTTGGNWDDTAFVGWANPGNDWSWEDQPLALLQFHPLPLPAGNTAGVDMVIDGGSLVTPKTPTAQRMEISFNGNALPTTALSLAAGQSVRVHIPAEWWNEACKQGFAKVFFRFPDARSPFLLGINTDRRFLGGGFRSIEFQASP